MTHTDQQMSRRTVLQKTGLGLTVATTGLGGFAATASATSDTQGVLAEGFTAEPDYGAFASGIVGRYRIGGLSAPETIETVADRARNEFNANAEQWISYGNFLLDEADAVGIGDAAVEVTFRFGRGRWPTRDEEDTTAIYVGYDSDADVFDSLEWTSAPPDDPDYEVVLEDRAAENAADELSEFRRKFIDSDGEDHELPDSSYLSELAGTYGGSIGVGEDSRSVLEVLLGEVDMDAF